MRASQATGGRLVADKQKSARLVIAARLAGWCALSWADCAAEGEVDAHTFDRSCQQGKRRLLVRLMEPVLSSLFVRALLPCYSRLMPRRRQQQCSAMQCCPRKHPLPALLLRPSTRSKQVQSLVGETWAEGGGQSSPGRWNARVGVSRRQLRHGNKGAEGVSKGREYGVE